MSHKVFIGIGSNLNKIKNIKSCISKIKNDYENVKLSPVYETKAMGFDGPNFYNLVCSFNTTEDIYKLKEKLNKIELDHGRNLNETKYSSRTLDIDILYYDNLILANDKIKIPRKEIIEYDFVLRPLIDIDPEFIHPVLLIPNNKIEEKNDIKKHIIAEVDINL
jgi:2-amino-4-hydroxy-6-hydroxymethyldihydropteridine diphosphokinase